MAFAPMSYRNYVWPYNPETIKIEHAKNIGTFKIPYSGNVLQNLGEKGRTVTGSGHFTGSGSTDEFKKLAAVFSVSGSGQLSLPGVSPFTAVFSSLTMKDAVKPNCIGYEFTFLEDLSSADKTESSTDSASYICKGGESLWDIAAKYETSVDKLVELNQGIEWPCNLEKGENVILP